MKKIISLLLILFLFSFTACGTGSNSEVKETIIETVPETNPHEYLTVPDITNTDEETANNILISAGFIPSVKYDFNDISNGNIAEGNVIKTAPPVNSKVKKENNRITVYISKGDRYIDAKDTIVEWYNLPYSADKWENVATTIENGDTLSIHCHVIFGCSMKWKDTNNSGYLFGLASINDSFDKTLPVKAKYEKQSWAANEEQYFTLKIPIKELNVTRPTDMYICLYTENSENVYVNFYMTW